MSGLHVPLDVEYASDDKIIEAGPMAELLFVRGLAFCKRTMSDGKISDRQLAAVALGLPAAKKNAAKLVDVGLWKKVRDGWVIVSWLKYNAPAREIEAAREMAKENGTRGNHDRWHCDEQGRIVKPSPKCSVCRANYRPPDPEPDRVGDRLAETTRLGGDVAKEEPEPEPLKEPEPEEEPEPSQVTSADGFENVVALIVDGRTRHAKPTRPDRYRPTVDADVRATLGPAITQALADHPDADPALIAIDLDRRAL